MNVESNQMRYKLGEGVPTWQEMAEGNEKYQMYLCSREWAERRNAVYKRCGCVCERCGLNGADLIHHLTYIRRYNELPEDLQALCRGCHAFIHGKSDHDPLSEWEKARPLASSLREDDSWNDLKCSLLTCPMCGFDYCHPGRPVYHDGQDAGKAPWCGRGDLIEIPVSCECGHEWEMGFGFHKGKVYAFTRNHRDTPQNGDDEC